MKPIKLLLTAFFLFILLPSCSSSSTPVQILPALQQANLSGRMIFILYNAKGNQLVEIDLSSGKMKTLFAAPERSWLAAAEISPDGKQFVLAYAPPPPRGQVQLANTDLYLLAADGSGSPQPLVQHAQQNESFAYPAWSPDGQAVSFTHTVPSTSNRLGIDSTIERVRPDGGNSVSGSEVILKNATWSRLSPDGARIAYLVLSEFTSNNALSLAGADGSKPSELVSARTYPIVDMHLFSPDGQEVYFSAPSPQSQRPAPVAGTQARGLAWLRDFWPSGVRTVTAHSNPSDWFRVSASGGTPQQLTHVGDVNMVAAFPPDGQRLAYVSQKGLFVMKPDGSGLTQLAALTGMGSLNWVK